MRSIADIIFELSVIVIDTVIMLGLVYAALYKDVDDTKLLIVIFCVILTNLLAAIFMDMDHKVPKDEEGEVESQ